MATAAPPEHPDIVSEPDGLFEVIDGRLVEKPMGVYEVWLVNVLYDLLNPFVKANSSGRVFQEMIFDLRPTVDRERRPDVAFISFERWASNRKVPQTRSWAVIPDLAIEVVSPTNTADEIAEKLDEYFRIGIRSVWVVYPRQLMIYVYRSRTEVRVFTLGDELDGGDVLPGFRVSLATIFEQGKE